MLELEIADDVFVIALFRGLFDAGCLLYSNELLYRLVSLNPTDK